MKISKSINFSVIVIIGLSIILFLALPFKSNVIDKSDFSKVFYGNYTEEEISKIKKQPASDINALILAMYYTRTEKADIAQRQFWTEMCSFYVGNMGICIKQSIVSGELEKEVVKSLSTKRAVFTGEKVNIVFNKSLNLTQNKIIYNQDIIEKDLSFINNSDQKCYYLHVGARNKNSIFIQLLTDEIEKYKTNRPSCYEELVKINVNFKTYINHYRQTITDTKNYFK